MRARVLPRPLRDLPKHLVLAVFSLAVLLPLYVMVVNTFKTNEGYLASPLGLPLHPSTAALDEAFSRGSFGRWLVNSTLVTLASVAVSTGVAILAAYSVALLRWRLRGLVLNLLIALMVVPPIVMVIPLFRLWVDLSLVYSYEGVVIIYSGLMLPFSIYMLASFFRTVPRELLEAAAIDGAGRFRTLVSMVLPLSGAVLVTLALVQGLWVWNELLIAVIFLSGDDAHATLMVGLTTLQNRYHQNVPLTLAGMLLATIPMVVAYAFGQRFFVRGLTAGSVKG
jgi:ABC-type glycerol-3-phosphate transport system permease component